MVGRLWHSLPIDLGPEALDSRHRLLVLPDAQHEPTLCLEVFGRVGVPRAVGGKLSRPPLGVGHWLSPMLGTPVPEAAVDEDRDLVAGEGDVDGPA